METLISIGERLRKVREDKGLSQSAFAEIAEQKGVAGATRQSQANYEKGKQAPSAAYLAAIAAAGADVHFILTGESPQRHMLAAIEASSKKVADLPLVNECKAAIAQLLVGLQMDNIGLITDALDIIRSDYVGLGEAKGAIPAAQSLRPDQVALLDNLERCAKEDQEAIKRITSIAAR